MDVSAALAAKDKLEAQKSKIDEPKTYKRYKREELVGLRKEKLIKVAAKLGVLVDKHDTNENIINIILGV
jgi:hypothetical protein